MAHTTETQHFAEVPLEVEAQLDRKVLTVRELLDLDTGSVIRLNRSAGENIDLLIGGSLVAFGEIVIFEEVLGVRITDFKTEEDSGWPPPDGTTK